MKTHLPLRRAVPVTRLGFLSVLLTVLLALPAGAQNKTIKVGVVDLDRIMARSSAFQSAAKRIEGELRPLKDRLTSKTNERDGLEQSIRDRSSVLKAEDIAQQKDKYMALDSEVRDINYSITKESDRLQREVLEPIMQRLKTIIEEAAKGQNYDLVLYANQVFYFSESVDLTPMVLQTLDKAGGTEAPVAKTDTKSTKSGDTTAGKAAATTKKSSRGKKN